MQVRARQRFEAEELAVILSRFDLGTLESVTEFERGSRQSPKVGIVSEKGKFLLKRRAERRRNADRVKFAHSVQHHLTSVGFPLPRLVATRDTASTVVEWGGEMYELFEFVDGHPFSFTPGQSGNAGQTLARFHGSVAGISVPDKRPSGTYHDTIGVRTGLNTIPRSISSHDSVVGFEDELVRIVHELFDEYDRAAESVNRIGGRPPFPIQVVHADWHPGNMLFRHDEVAAVMDYDSCRLAERVTDVANGVLHFSLNSGGHPDEWDDEPEEIRFRSFMEGYRHEIELDLHERDAVLPLMIEALIAESVLPIAQAGSFGRWAGFGFLRMVARKVRWFNEHRDDVATWLAA